jgi:hypothetical protein
VCRWPSSRNGRISKPCCIRNYRFCRQSCVWGIRAGATIAAVQKSCYSCTNNDSHVPSAGNAMNV